jgi:hypothetical protein
MFAQAISWTITLVVVRLLSPQDDGLMGMAVAARDDERRLALDPPDRRLC